ncbi:hypothetical protein VFPFJ_04383 [Purpureocillium lilacinum]|uniref:Uncharacterized protein n=1 Tax=Purpureocillium lilacinum TaxID=33203 RepID=A0A179HJP5_PURLI|nr:hypothetical protein VFPFJ_04383 [Purpureocillium lilacinum]OAQ90224.1 hypothetical protein VFPFJ_04383 [Purpureocillium lilacinum]
MHCRPLPPTGADWRARSLGVARARARSRETPLTRWSLLHCDPQLERLAYARRCPSWRVPLQKGGLDTRDVCERARTEGSGCEVQFEPPGRLRLRLLLEPSSNARRPSSPFPAWCCLDDVDRGDDSTNQRRKTGRSRHSRQ